MTADEVVVGGSRFATDVDGFEAMTEYVKQWPDRVSGDRGPQKTQALCSVVLTVDA